MAQHPNRPNRTPRKAVGYVRVSTAGQADDGESLAAQEQRIKGHCAARGLELVAIHRDAGLSGTTTARRAGLEAALRETCAMKGVLVFASLSRLARSVPDAIAISERVRACGGDLASVAEALDTSSPAGELLFTLLAALGRLESRQIGERTAAVLGHLRAEGRRYSRRIPFGFRPVGDRLERDEAEQATLRAIKRLQAGGLGTRATATALNARGLTRRDGRAWTWEAVRDVLAAKARELDKPAGRHARAEAGPTGPRPARSRRAPQAAPSNPQGHSK